MEDNKSYTNLDVWKKSRKLNEFNLQFNKKLPKGRNVWINKPDKEMRNIYPFKHRRRLRQKFPKRFNSIFPHSPGLSLRIRSSTLHIIRPGLYYRERFKRESLFDYRLQKIN